MSCAFTLILAAFVLEFYTIDPQDRDLIINEQAKYLTSKTDVFNELKDIVSVTQLKEEMKRRILEKD